MKETIDYQLKDIINSKENAPLLYGINKQSITKIITSCERNFFSDKNILRANDKKSDFLFRFEIKDLLVLLIYVLHKTPFDPIDFKTSFTENDIKKLKNISATIKNTKLPQYERVLIDAAYQDNVFIDKANDLSRLKDSFVDLFSIIAMNYYTFSQGYFKELTGIINKLSFNIARHKEVFDSYAKITGENKLNKYKMNYIYPLVNLIEEVAELLYEFDEKGCCKRKEFFDVAFERLRNRVPDSEADIDRLKQKKSKILSNDENSYLQYVGVDIDKCKDVELVKSIHKNIQNLLDDYFDCFFEVFKKEKFEEISYMNNIINERDKHTRNINHERYIKLYLQNWYIVNAKLNNVEDQQIEKEINKCTIENLNEDEYYNIIVNSTAESYEEFTEYLTKKKVDFADFTKTLFNENFLYGIQFEKLDKSNYKSFFKKMCILEPSCKEFIDKICERHCDTVKSKIYKKIVEQYNQEKEYFKLYIDYISEMEDFLWCIVNEKKLNLSNVTEDADILHIIKSRLKREEDIQKIVIKNNIDKERDYIKEESQNISKSMDKIIENIIYMELKLEDTRSKNRTLTIMNNIWNNPPKYD